MNWQGFLDRNYNVMIVEENQKTLANNVCVCFVPVVFVYYMYAIFSELSSELHFVEYKPLVKYERLVRLAIWPNTICKIILSSPVSFQ